MATEYEQSDFSRGTATAERRLNDTIDEAGQRAADAARPGVEKVQSFAEQQKKMGAGQIDGVARAVHRAAEEIEGQLPRVARSVHQAASRLDAASSSLRERSMDELLTSFGEFARSQPWVLFGGAVLTGFALSRFLKSSAHDDAGELGRSS